MSLVKRIGRSDTVRHALSWSIASYIRAIWATNRWTVEGAEHPERLHVAKRPYIGAFWHGRMLMMPFGWPRAMPLAMLHSGHRDGRIIADAVHRLGIDNIFGSSSRGGSEGLRLMVRAMRNGSCVAITPDAEGPAMSASLGIVHVARIAGAPIAPITYATSRRVVLENWDRFHLPLPFGRGIFLIGEPIEVPSDTNPDQTEALRVLLETRLRTMTAEADRRMGHGVLTPGTLSREAFRARRRAASRSS